MKSRGSIVVEYRAEVRAALWIPQPKDRPSLSRWVTTEDVQDLAGMLQRGAVPGDFQTKLLELAGGGLAEQHIEKNCRLFVALLTAAYSGAFREITKAECDRLLQVLAYVRKTNDAIPDYKDDGFVDDQQEVLAAATELAPMLQNFKAWRLRYQVPAMWATANVSGRFSTHLQ